jgi:hypothetical protein
MFGRLQIAVMIDTCLGNDKRRMARTDGEAFYLHDELLDQLFVALQIRRPSLDEFFHEQISRRFSANGRF